MTFRKLGPRDFKGEGDEDSAPAPSSFIANAYNEIYAFYTRKAAYWKKLSTLPLPPLLNPPLMRRSNNSS